MKRLGSGRLAAEGVGPKAALLDRARRAGLAVPEGFVVSEGETVVEPRGGRWAVRSAFGAEDGGERSMAGWFLSKLNVEAGAVAAAVEEVRASAARREGAFRRDVLVMRMVEAQAAGVVFTESEFEDDLVNWTAGTAEALVGGGVEGERMTLAKRRAGEPGTAPGGWPRRLQALLRGVRREFGERDWDVEWADDGERCWLVQVRPVTAAARRNEAFTLANHKEILPDLPSTLMTSVIVAAAPELFGYYRRFDASLPRRRLFIEEFAGRPLINISLMTEMMRRWGLPTSLVTGNIGGETDRAAGLNPWRMLRKLPVLVRVGWAQMRAAGEARRTVERLRRLPAPEGFGEAVERLRGAYVALVEGMFGLTSAMSGPLALLRRAGTLDAWQARHETVTARMARELGHLEEGEWLARYGHRGVYESDVARPRFREEPPRAARGRQAARVKPPALGWRGWLTAPLWRQAARPLAQREWFRHEMMREFGRVREALLAACERGGVEPESLWLLRMEEAARLDDGWRPGTELLAERRAERERRVGMRLPDLVRRFDELGGDEGEECAGREVWRGLSLTRGEVEGRAWVAAEPGEAWPEGFEPERTVVVARAVDAGWIGVFQQAAGVVVETGGDLSHGSILLRELGVPAVTNVRGVTRGLATGDWVWLDAARGTVRVAGRERVNPDGERSISTA